MAPTLTPIATRYKGYLFRSRLEARYAVLFDHLHIRWEYELEGYNAGGVWYLPDFALIDFQCFAEVKAGTFSAAEFARAAALGTCLLLDGMPEVRRYHATGHGHCCGTSYAHYVSGHKWGAVLLHASAEKGRLWFDVEASLDRFPLQPFQDAVDAARSARFEHGEHPLRASKKHEDAL
jgi:hypothetical protein